MRSDEGRFLIWVIDDDHTSRAFVGPVPARLMAYLRSELEPQLHPLSDQEYLDGHSVIPCTAARSSYIVTDGSVFWIVEWEPGLLVTRFDAPGAMRSAAFATTAGDDDDLYDDPQSVARLHDDLVFEAWDCQFDAELRALGGFAPDDHGVEAVFDTVMAHVVDLQAEAGRSRAEAESLERWHDRRTTALRAWSTWNMGRVHTDD